MFLKKTLIEVKENDQHHIILKYFGIPQHRHTIETSHVKFRLLIERYTQFDFFEKSLCLGSSLRFVYYFSRKTFLMLYSQLTKFHCSIVFFSCDIGYCVYYN